MRHLLYSLILLIPSSSFAQPTKEEILVDLTEIKSIDILDDNFTGYEVLSEKIGDARIVLLGEQTHGHGTTFTAKNKIIKYLVEKHGFDVIAFESGFFELNKIWDSDLSLTEKIDKIKGEIYPLWTASEELKPLFNFVKDANENGKRLDLTGFDCKHDMTYGQKYYTSDFNSFLTNNKLPIVESLDYVKFKPILDNLIKLKLNFNEDAKSRPKPEELKLFNGVLDSIQSQITRLPKTPESELWRQELKSLKMQARNTWIASSLKGVARLAVRDSAMADNLIWLADNKYKGRKIIVWAASYHIAKEKQELTFKGVNTKSVEMMGSMINLKLPNQVFSLGFVSPEGSYGEWYKQKFLTYPINRTANSIEKTISSLCMYNYAFLDFKKTSNNDKFLMA